MLTSNLLLEMERSFSKEKLLLAGFKILGFIILLVIIMVITTNLFPLSSFAQNPEASLSILYFSNYTNQADWDWLSKGLADMLINDLTEIDSITCSSREEIEDFYTKYNLSPYQTEPDQPLLIKAKEDFKTDAIFFGDFSFTSSAELVLKLKKYDSVNGEITAFREVYVEKDKLFRLKEEVAFLILEELHLELSPKVQEVIQEVPTSSSEALINYYKALDFRDRAIKEYQGVDYPSKKLWAQAINYGEKAIALDPQYFEAYYLLAEIYNRTRWTAKEVDTLTKFIQLVEDNQLKSKRIYPQIAQAYFKLGYSFYSRKELDQAIEYFNLSIQYNPNLLEPHIYLTMAYYDKGEMDLAFKESEEVLRIDPQNQEISWLFKKVEQSHKYGQKAYENYEKGYLAYKEGNYTEAINYFRSSISNNPEFKEPRYFLALTYYNIADYDNSISQWEEVIRLDPFDNSARLYLNKALEEKEYGRETLKYFESGYDYYLKGEYEKAVEEFNKSLSYNPKYEKARQFLSRSYYQLNQMDKYREEVEKLAELKTSGEEERAEEHYKLGYEFYSLNDYEVAIEEFKKALSLKSNHYPARFLLGECYFQKEEYKLAQAEYEQLAIASEKNEYTDDALLGSGWCLYLMGEYQPATERFLRLIEEFPESNLIPAASSKLCASYWKRGDYSKALEVGKEFLVKYAQFSGPEIEEIYYYVGQSYLGLEQYREAEETFAQLASQYPNFTLIEEVKYLRSLCLFKLERYEEAIAELEKLIDTEGEGRAKDEARYLLARCWLNKADYEAAIKNLEYLKNNATEDSLREKVIFDLGLAYSLKGDKEKAILEFQEFIERYPGSELIDAAHFELGKSLYSLKKYPLALTELEKVSTAEALYLRGKAAEEMGDKDTEISFLKELIEKFPEDEYAQEAYFKLGYYYYHQNQYKEALEEFGKLIKYFPDSPLLTESYYWLAWSHFKLKEYPQASEYFEKVELEGGEISLELAQRAKFMVGEARYNLKDYSRAREAYRNFMEKYPETELSASAQYAIAWTYFEEQDYESAIREFAQVTSLYPESEFTEEAQFRIAQGYFFLGEKEKAKTAFKDFIDSKVDSNFRVEALYLLSQIYLGEEEWIDSIIELERLIREYPGNKYYPEALYGLSLSYLKKGEYNKAIEVAEEYLKDYNELEFADDLLYIKATCWENLENQEKAKADYQALISTFPQSPYVEAAKERLKVLQ